MSVRPLPPILAEKARLELFEDPKRIEGDLQHIKDWLAKQKHLNARTDDQWLLSFLRGSKYSLERTKEKLDLYYSVRTTAPEFFSVKHTSKLFEELLNLGVFLPLPKLANPDDPVTILLRNGKYDPNVYSVHDIIAASGLINKLLVIDNDNAVVSGVRTIFDMDGVSMAHFLHVTPVSLKKMIVIGQDASPLRMKGAHYLNSPTFFEKLFNAMKVFLNEKNRNRIYVHNKNQSLFEHIPKEIFPEEYGGNGGTEKEIIEYWRNKVQEYSSWLEEDGKFCTDESKRPGKPRTAETMFGLDGSFRQLDFD